MDIQSKVKVLSDGSYGCYIAYRKASYFLSKDLSELGYVSERNQSNFDNACVDVSLFSETDLIECERIYRNSRMRGLRLRKRISLWSKQGFVYFLTLTFRDESLANTDSQTRRKYVSRFLKSLGVMYCANLDFGGQFGREHYHALICAQYPFQGEYKHYYGGVFLECSVFDEWQTKRGFYSLEGPIKLSDDVGRLNSLKISKYISKASNHALKETALHSTLIYSRGGCPWKSVVSTYQYNGGFFAVTDDQLAELPFDVNENMQE